MKLSSAKRVKSAKTTAANLRLLKSYKSKDGKREAKVYKDHDWDEHRTKFFENGKHLKKADYHDDADGCHDSAKHFVGASKINTETADPYKNTGVIKLATKIAALTGGTPLYFRDGGSYSISNPTKGKADVIELLRTNGYKVKLKTKSTSYWVGKSKDIYIVVGISTGAKLRINVHPTTDYEDYLDNGETAAATDTPTDLDQEAVAKEVVALNGLLADSTALWFKAKNFHWHLSGAQFRDLHLLFDEHADAIYALVDPIAERIRKLGGIALGSLKQCSGQTVIQEVDGSALPPMDMVKALLADNRAFIKRLRLTHAAAKDAQDVATTALIEVWIDEAERRVWFLYEITQDPAQTTATVAAYMQVKAEATKSKK